MKTGKKYFRDGNVDIVCTINATTWKRMTDKEKARFTPFSEKDLAPIPDEVLEFQQNPDPCCDEDSKCKKLEAEIAGLQEKLKLATDKKYVKDLVEEGKLHSKLDKDVVIVTNEIERKQLLEECRKRNIKTTHNMKLETLKKKLKDADD